MNKIYFAKTKDTQKLYIGRKGHTGFSRIGDLKSSISYTQRCCGGKSKDEYDFYCVDTDTMTAEKYKK